MSQDDIPPRIIKSRLLKFEDDGTVGLRRERLLLPLLAGIVFPAICLTYLHYRSDTWFGPPLIVCGAIAAIAWYAMDARRQLLIARDPGRARRLSLAELMLLVTIAIVLAGGFAINQQQRRQEMARRAELKAKVEAVLGPGGVLARDHRGRIWLTISDPAFNDKRFEQLVETLQGEPSRYGVSRVVFQPARGMRLGPDGLIWLNVTDRSVMLLSRWSQLRELYLQGTAITESGAIQLTDLPKLRWLDWTSNFSPENAVEIKRKRPDLWIGGPGDFP